jgi:hypothetical protein
MEEDIEMALYKRMCRSCPNARKCHEECETCEEYEKESERLLGEKHGTIKL